MDCVAAVLLLTRTLAVVIAVLITSAASSAASSPLPHLPAHWPTTLQIGLTDAPGGAAALRAAAPFGFRYQYLAGGVNTGQGWSTWNPDGTFASMYVAGLVVARDDPGASPTTCCCSRTRSGGDEAHADLAHLRNATR